MSVSIKTININEIVNVFGAGEGQNTAGNAASQVMAAVPIIASVAEVPFNPPYGPSRGESAQQDD